MAREKEPVHKVVMTEGKNKNPVQKCTGFLFYTVYTHRAFLLDGGGHKSIL
jgi:hypothetical protein